MRVLKERGEEVWGTYGSRPQAGLEALDVGDAQRVFEVLQRVRPHRVWLPAALPDVDRCEREPQLSYRVNVVGPRNVGQAAQALDAQVIFFSTDYVFDGTKGPYRESDPVRPLQVYGRHKVQAEEYLLAQVPKTLIVRPAWIYSHDPHPRNFVWRIAQQLKAGEVLKSAVDQVNTPTPAKELALRAVQAAEMGMTGVLHLVGPERLSRYDLTRRIADLLGYPQAAIQPVTTSSLNLPARRPLAGGLVTDFPDYRLTEPLAVGQGLR